MKVHAKIFRIHIYYLVTSYTKTRKEILAFGICSYVVLKTRPIVPSTRVVTLQGRRVMLDYARRR